jgi:hypothetical protein
MDVGDPVTKTSDDTFRGTIVQLPRSIGRKRPRALVATLSGESWVPLDELKKVDSDVDT